MKKIGVISSLIIIFIVFLSSCCSSLDIEGKWYCEDLKLYISFGDEDPKAVCYLDYDYSEYIKCGVWQRGSGLKVICNELNNYRYRQNHCFLDGRVISVRDDAFVVKESGKRYTFKKVDEVPVIDVTITEEMLERLNNLGISIMQEGFFSDYIIPELEYGVFMDFVRGETSIEQVDAFIDIQYVKQKENHFYLTANVDRDGQKQLTYIDFGWDLTFDHSWEIHYSESIQKADLDTLTAEVNREEMQNRDPQGDFSAFRWDKLRYNQMSYHAVQDEDGHGYGYWILYDGHTPEYKVIGIYKIETY